MKKVLVLCTGNSCRSQMAHGFLESILNDHIIFSAGTKPEPVNKYAVEVMSEHGIDISQNTSNYIDEYLDHEIDLVLTVCDNAKEICPVFPKETDFIHYSFEDPAEAKGSHQEKLVVYKKVRDEIHNFIRSEFIDIINNKT
tara:strand:- start:727 stop:1149 length:423 start_codon:yes stop_codon:yes gene_type:complete